MLTTIATAEKAFREFFLTPAVKQLDEKSGPFLAMLEKSTKDVSGKDIRMPLVYGRSGGIGNRAEDGTLPTPNPRKWTHAVWETKNIYGRISLTGKSIQASRDDKGAFVRLLRAQMDDLLNDANNDLRRQSFGDGTGLLSLVAAAGCTADVVIPVDDIRFFKEGKVIDVLNGTTKADIAADREILVVDRVNSTITVSGANLTCADNDWIVIADNYNMELTGVQAVMTPDTTLYGIDRSTNKWMNPNVTAVGGEITEIVMQQAIDEAMENLGSDINFIMCNNAVARGYQLDQLSYKKNIKIMEIKGGYKVMSYNDIPIAKDMYMPSGTMDFLHKEDWKMYRMGPWNWMQRDGSIFSRLADTDGYEATLYQYCDIGCRKVGGQSRLTGITEH